MKARSMRRISVSSQVLNSDVSIIVFISYKSSHVSKLFASAPTGQGIIVFNLSHDARYISTDTSI